MKVVLATHNAGKIRELKALLSQVDIEVISQAELNIKEIEETGLSFVENALLKARHAAKLANLPAIADDSGLTVNCLKGAPGIHSARYAGEKANAHDNIQKLLTALKNVPDEKRGAIFYCVLVFVAHADDPMPIICEATWEGKILTSMQGKEGFGYDPVFYVNSEHKSAALLPLEVKNKISHRGKALQLLIEKLSIIKKSSGNL